MAKNVANFPKNSNDDNEKGQQNPEAAGKRLMSFLERVERMEEERKEINEDIKEIMSEAKGVGFDTKILRRIIKLRKMEPEKRREEDELLDLYMKAIGME